MNDIAQRIYFALPSWLQTAALSAYGAVLRSRRRGRTYRATLRELSRSERYTRNELERLQLGRLRAVVAMAYASVPLYRERGSPPTLAGLADIERLPLLDKASLQQPRYHVVSDRPHGRRLEIHTGGTTGRSLTIHCDTHAMQRNYAFFHRFLGWAGVSPSDRVATFAGRTIVAPDREQPPYWRRNLAANQLLLSSYHLAPGTLPLYLEALRRFQPIWIDSYPSSLLPIARHILEKRDLAVRPRAVITSSETLSAEARSAIEAAFGCPVFDHYGAAEMATLITQCERGSYHPNPEFGLTELLIDGRRAKEGEVGEIVATGFVNDVMPLLRYRTGDLAARSAAPCSCGRAFPVFERIIGRADDVIETPDGRLIGRLDPVFKSVSRVQECQIVQDSPDHVTVRYVAGGELPDEEAAALVRELSRRLGPAMRISLVQESSLPRSPSGKLRTVVNTWKPAAS